MLTRSPRKEKFMSAPSTTLPLNDSKPFSEQALLRYRDRLKELTDQAAKFHGELLREAEHEAKLNGVLKRNFYLWRRDHGEALGEMLTSHRRILSDVQRLLSKEHPDL